MPARALTHETLDQTIQDNAIVVLDFWAPWCGPCRSFAPVFEAASDKHPGIVFGKINTQDEPSVASALQIQSIPTLMLFRDQVMLFRQAGALPPQALEDLLQKARDLDMDQVRAEIAAQSDS